MKSLKGIHIIYILIIFILLIDMANKSNAQATQILQLTRNTNNLLNSACPMSNFSTTFSSKNMEKIMIERYLNINIKNDTQTIFKIFDKILWDLEVFKEKLNTDNNDLLETKPKQEIRKRRGVPRLNINECSITKDELIAFNNEIRNILELNQTLRSQNSCELNPTSTKCSELLKSIKCGIMNLKNQFIEITSNTVSANEIIKWKNMYEKMNELNSRIEDDLRRKLDQEYSTQINELKTDLQNFKQHIEQLEKKLKEANENIKQITIKFCASEIHSKRINNCFIDLNYLHKIILDINYTEVVNKIIETSYNYIVKEEDMPIIDYMIDFIAHLRSDLKITAADTLYKKMYEKNHLNSNYVLTFNSKIDIKSSTLSNNLKTATSNILFKYGNRIRSYNSINEILLYARHQINTFYNNLEEIIANAYSKNIKNSENIIFFLDNLHYVEHQIIGYYSLYNEIIRNNNFRGHEIIMIVSRIKKIKEGSLFSQIQVKEKNLILNIINRVPSGVRALLWNDYVNIKSKYNKYKLVQLQKYFEFIHIETILAICPSYVNAADKWRITEQENGRYYKIQNVDKNYDDDFYWIISADWNGAGFFLTNKKNNVPLYRKDRIGGWIGFWYEIPGDCYEVFDNNYNSNYEGWEIS